MYPIEFISPLIFLIVLISPFWLFRLSKRVKNLEMRLPNTNTTPKIEEKTGETSPAPASTSFFDVQTNTSKQALKIKTEGFDFVLWLKEDWLLKLGALLILLGFGWLTAYAFNHNWIGSVGLITMGIVGGTLILTLGFWRAKKFIRQGSVFLVLGSTVIILITFAARQIYDFFNPLSALLIMFASASFVALSSLKYKTEHLAFASLILAAIAPLLVKASPLYTALFAYLFVITLGTLWIVVLTGWRTLVTTALFIVAIYSFPHLLPFSGADRQALLLFAYAFSALFFAASSLGALKQKNEDKADPRPDLITAGGTGVFLLAWITTVAKPEWQVLIILAWMLVFAIGAFSIFRLTGKKNIFYTQASVSILYLAVATLIQIGADNTPLLTMAYTIEATLITVFVYVINKNRLLTEKISWLMIGPAILSFGSIFSVSWEDGFLHQDFSALFLLAITLGSLGHFFWYLAKKSGEQSAEGNLFMIASSIYAYILLWLSLHAGNNGGNDASTMIALVIYTIIGLATYIEGRGDKKALRYYGSVLLAFVVGWLLIVELGKMEIASKVVTLLLIGALLASTAFIGRAKKSAISISKK